MRESELGFDITCPNPATVAEVSRFTGSGDDGVRAAIHRGELPAVRINRRGDYRIYHAQLRQWLLSQMTIQAAK